ncbi:MAG: Hsp70 family protein, partial [bacterium]|nr:Hsp70 family protein [bacterium]
ANGILSVKAKEKASGKEQSIRIEARSGLTDAEVKKMQADAEVNAEADKKKKELIEAQNGADQVIYAAEKAVKEYSDKVTPEIKKDVEEKIAALKTARAGTDTAAIKTATETLSAAMSAIGPAVAKAKADEEAMSKERPQTPPTDQPARPDDSGHSGGKPPENPEQK